MKIGELASATNTQVETIRYYEREGLIPKPGRSGSNYRIYGNEHVKRLSFIRHCRSLDMSLAEIRSLLHFKDAPTDNCGEVNRLLDEHICHVALRIRELQNLKGQLKELRKQCQMEQAAAHCGILGGLEHAASPDLQKPEQIGHVHGTHGSGSMRSKS